MPKARGIRSMLDVLCGDWHWMTTFDLGDIDNIGADIVDELVQQKLFNYAAPGRRFIRLDLMRDELPRYDLVFVCDYLVQLEEDQIREAVRNIAAAGSTYLAATTLGNVAYGSDPKPTDRWQSLI
jgi:hypothetical protein